MAEDTFFAGGVTTNEGAEDIFVQLLPASFKGVPFLFQSHSTTTGRKVVIHEFVNTDRRFVQDLGKLSKKIKIIGVLTGDGYFVHRNDLIQALQSEGPGILQHPFLGNLKVVALPGTFTETTQAVGKAVFNMQFERADKNIYPKEVDRYGSRIKDGSNKSKDESKNAFNNHYTVPFTDHETFNDANSMYDNFADKMFNVRSNYSTKGENVDTFDARLDTFNRNKVFNLKNTNDFSDSTSELFDTLGNSSVSDDQKINIYKEFFNYKIPDPIFNLVTPARETQYENRRSFESFINIHALISAYEAVPFLSYFDTIDVEDIFSLLEEQYSSILNNTIYTVEELEKLKILRNNVRKFLTTELEAVYDIIIIETVDIPLRVLSFNYYGSTDNYERLINLNTISTPAHIKGSVEIFGSKE